MLKQVIKMDVASSNGLPLCEYSKVSGQVDNPQGHM